jgi:hypothetical protein
MLSWYYNSQFLIFLKYLLVVSTNLICCMHEYGGFSGAVTINSLIELQNFLILHCLTHLAHWLSNVFVSFAPQFGTLALFVYFWRYSPPPPQWARAAAFTRFLDHTQQHTTDGWTPLEEWSARRRDLCLTTHITQTNIRAPGGIRTHNLSKRAAADPRLRPRGHWDGPAMFNEIKYQGMEVSSEMKIQVFWDVKPC